LAGMFTRKDGYPVLLTIIRHVLVTGALPHWPIEATTSSGGLTVPDLTLGGVTKLIEEVLSDYEQSRSKIEVPRYSARD